MSVVIAGEVDFPPENRMAALDGAKDLIALALAASSPSFFMDNKVIYQGF